MSPWQVAVTVLSISWTSYSLASVVFPADTQWRYLPGRAEASPGDPLAWRTIGFEDSAWKTGPAPFYYEDQPTSGTAYTGNTALTDMRGNYTCLFLRKPFVIDHPADVQTLELTALSDDGFIAWINGREVARFNMPLGDIPYDGVALPALAEPVAVQTNRLSLADVPLVPGTNVLAVQAFNSSIGSSSDFVIWAALSSSADTEAPVVKTLIPPANALVRQCKQVEVIFSEDVAGVDASDLLVNGQPASAVTAFNGAQYLFEFPEPTPGTVHLSWDPAHGIRDLASTANPFGGGTWSYTLDPNAAPPGLIISELMADNKTTLHDEDGDSSDWIEILNTGDTVGDLNGYYLTGQSNVTQWRFPQVTLLPNSYLVVFASQKNRIDPTAPLHTNFKLDKTGGYLALLDPDGKPVSEFPAYPGQLRDVSYGRDRSNPNLLAFFPQPTPGAPNSEGGPGFAPAVTFSRPAGTFLEPFGLTLSTELTNAVIHYTLDGSFPSSNSPVCTGSVPIQTTVQVRAMSFVEGLLPGPPHSQSYLALSNNLVGFSSDLPVVVLDNFGAGTVPAGTRQFANLALFEPVAGRTYLTNQATLSTRSGINLRGSSTLYQAKSNYRVEFWDDFDLGTDYSVLGMPADNDWILYAPDNFEPVLIHNPFMHDLSRQIGRYSPRTRFVEVYVNTAGGPLSQANYRGVYVLLEKVKQGKDRVDIAKLEPEQSRLPEVSGGYLMSVDRSPPGEGQLYGGGLGVNALAPKWDELVQPQRAPQMQFITQFLDTFYNALYSPNFTNPVTGYPAYVDISSAIDHHILNVLAFNVDALRLSSYFYKARSGKLGFGPLWDFDRALGSTDGRDANPRLWRSTGGDLGTDMFNSAPIFSNPWYSQMFRDPDFWQRWIDRWQELRRHEFALTNLHGLVDSLANQVRESQRREVARWPGFTSPRGGSYQAEVDRMKTWLSNRVDFIDTNLLAVPVFSSPPSSIPAGFQLSVTAPAEATIYYTLDGSDPRAPGGAIADRAHAYAGPIALAQNARIVARARDLNHRNLTGANKPPLTSPWSGPETATYVVSTPPLVVTEVMYHPPAAPAGGTNNEEQFEYLELKNVGSQALDLAGFHFTHGIEYGFTAASAVTTLAPGAYVLLVKNQSAFTSRYPAVTNVAGEYSGSLDNSGERLALEGPLDEPILDFSYSPGWYPSTDGHGFSLVIANEHAPLTNWADPANWRASNEPNGSPGFGDPNTAPSISSFQIEGDKGVVQFYAEVGRTFSVLYAPTLSAPTWTKLIDLGPPAAPGPLRVIDSSISSAPQRFYRLVTPAAP